LRRHTCAKSQSYNRVVIATAEYELVTEGVGALERPDRVKLLLSGAEAAEFLQGQVTNDVEGLEPGEGCYAALLTHKGKIRTDLRVLRSDDWLWLDAAEIGRRPLVHTIQTYSLGRDVRFEDVTEERTILSLIGPAAREALDAPPPDPEHSFVSGEHGLYVTTDLGVDVICDTADAEGVREALGVEPVSEQVAECLRIERGRPRLGLDMDGDTIPEEAGLNERAVSFDKGCYVGQETVARLHYRGKPNRHLRGLRLSSPASTGEPVHLGERQVGTVGSACESPLLGPIALAVLRREAAPGETVSVSEAGEAQVVELPFAPG
jgi:folate-binding protein YgfZ